MSQSRTLAVSAGVGVLCLVTGIAIGRLTAPAEVEPAPAVEAPTTDVAKTEVDGEAPANPQPVQVPEHPNVLIILWDTVRADRLSMYGYDKPTTPNMDKFASEGRIFDQAVSAGIWTVPSHASMFTGLYPTTHGAGFEWRWLDNHHSTLAEHFGGHGYDTYAFAANPNLSPTSANLVQGFDTVHNSFRGRFRQAVARVTQQKLIRNDASSELSPAWSGNKAGVGAWYNAGPVGQRAFLEWEKRREDRGKPWLAYLNYMEAHRPRVPSMKARKKVMDKDAHQLALTTDAGLMNQLAYTWGKLEYTDAELEAMAGVYDASLVDLDGMTGNFLAELERQGLLENTIVVFTSDHGENLGEHHLMGHNQGMFDTLARVPLVVWYPKKVDAGRVSEPITTAHLFGTLTKLADLPAPGPTVEAHDLMHDPKGLVFLEETSWDSKGMIKVSNHFGEVENSPWTKIYEAVVEHQYKLIRDNEGGHSLYDLHADPDELNDIAAQDAATVARLNKRLDEWRAALPKYDASRRDEGDAPEIDDELAEQLKMLGYVQ